MAAANLKGRVLRGQYPTRHPEAGGGHSGHCASVAADGRMARRRRRHARDSEAGSRLGAGRLDSPPSGLSKPWLGQGQLLCPERRLPAVFARLSWASCCVRRGDCQQSSPGYHETPVHAMHAVVRERHWRGTGARRAGAAPAPSRCAYRTARVDGGSEAAPARAGPERQALAGSRVTDAMLDST